MDAMERRELDMPPEVAQGALDVLDRDGWCKGAFTVTSENRSGQPEGSHCIRGAAMRAEVASVLHYGYRNLLAVLDAEWPGRMKQIRGRYSAEHPGAVLRPVALVTRFNDHEDTTEDDVRWALQKVAAG